MKENAQVAIGTVPKNPRKIRNQKKTIAKIEMLLAKQTEVKKKA
jgi:ribosomal protein L29